MMCAAMAGLCGLIIDLVSVVVGEFLTCLDIPDRDNPDRIPELFCVAVGITRMVDKACRVLGRIPVNGKALIQVEDGSISGTGAIGVWTKADSVTAFDDFAYGAVSR